MPIPSLELLVALIASVVNLVLAVFIYLNNSRSATNKFFSLLAISIASYLFTNYLSLHQDSESITLLWVRAVMSIAPFTNLFFLLLASSYPNETLQMKKRTLWLVIITTIFLSIIAQTKLIFVKAELGPQGVQPTPGRLIPLFLIHTFAFLGGGFFVLLRKFKRFTGTERRQIKILLLGAVLMFSLILISNLLLVVLFNVSTFVGFLPIYTLVFTGFVSYAIVKHSLFDLRVLATQAFSIVLLIILFSKIFIAGSTGEAIVDSLVFVAGGFFSVLLIRSVIREVEQREKLEELTEKLKALDKQKDVFISMAAHELRAPMTAIKGYVSMVLEGDTGDIPEKARGFLADANNINDRLIRLVNNMLNVSRIEEGRMVYQVEEENLSNPVRAVYSQFTPEAERKGLKYTLDIPNAIKDRVSVDPDRIHDVIVNLLSNAVKYTDTGFVKVRLSQPDQKTVRCEVIDSGSGIEEDEQKKLFQKFHRVETNVGKTTRTD